VEPQALRTDDYVRKIVKEDAEEILDVMKAYMGEMEGGC
jgi:hypothetical protein